MEQSNFYEVLRVKSTATFEEIKKSYQQLILQYHPDKKNFEANDSSLDDNQIFIEIDRAWKILRDSEKRKKYDAEARQAKYDDKPIIHETLRRADFDFDKEIKVYYRDCRCGGNYSIPENCTKENIYIGCDECSLMVELVNE